MFFIFIYLLLISLGIFLLLLWVIKTDKLTARNIEFIGYLLLVVSLIWTGVYNLTQEVSRGSEFIMLDERLRVLWLYEGAKKEYYNNENIDDLNDAYYELTKHLQGPVFDNKLIKEQEDFTNKVHYGLFVLSSLFISAGRISEVFHDSSTNKNLNKNKKRTNKKAERVYKRKKQ